MRNTYLLVVACLAAGPALAAPATPAKHAQHAKATKHPKTARQRQFDAIVAGNVAGLNNLTAQADDARLSTEAYSRGDRAAMYDAEARMQERECKDRSLYMQAYERASPSERMVLHERCYGSRGR